MEYKYFYTPLNIYIKVVLMAIGKVGRY